MSCLVQQFGFEDRNDLEKVDVDSLPELDRLDDRYQRSHDEKVTHVGVWPKRLRSRNRMAVRQDYLFASGIQGERCQRACNLVSRWMQTQNEFDAMASVIWIDRVIARSPRALCIA